MLEESDKTIPVFTSGMDNLKLSKQGLESVLLHLMDLSLKTMALISCLSYLVSDL